MSGRQQGQVEFWPAGKSVLVPEGATLLAAARRAGVHLPVRCDGRAACLMCKVTVLPEDQPVEGISLSPPGAVESRKLGASLEEHIRLGCQARVTGHCVVRIPEDRLKAAIRKQMEQQNDDLSDW
ncbi:2Fe-2S iron-sulfur cluster-binding protein [Paenibacillus wulumuqiensis]|uniref:2Fe-2S iron-sulfur cluster-binding protein n=1 Tax=Paenibacillus wulumuqiensis TaxID=1567107 RepID=UPI0006192121|nr:2Fe-2S iron-sulfur cluster-binding protein [Paenibacillus wulumuqiensis]